MNPSRPNCQEPEPSDCEWCGGDVEPSGDCENFFCPGYVSPILEKDLKDAN